MRKQEVGVLQLQEDDLNQFDDLGINTSFEVPLVEEFETEESTIVWKEKRLNTFLELQIVKMEKVRRNEVDLRDPSSLSGSYPWNWLLCLPSSAQHRKFKLLNHPAKHAVRF